MDRGRVGEDRGSKETDGYPLTNWTYTRCSNQLSYQALPVESNMWMVRALTLRVYQPLERLMSSETA
jgi:hypothetical protein